MPKLSFSEARDKLHTANSWLMFNPNNRGNKGHFQLYIEAIEHKAFVEVNEEGTEAAAATGISFGATSAPITQDFHVDRPFLFRIVDKETQSVLFISRVTDPSAAK